MSSQDQSQNAGALAASGNDSAVTACDFSLKDLPDSFFEDPYPTYRELQSIDPVHKLPDGSLFLTRYNDLEAIYKDTTRFSSDKKVEFAPKYGAGSLLFQHHTTSLVFNDPPLHTRVRRLIAGALNPRAISELEPSLIVLVDSLLDRIEARGAPPAPRLVTLHPGGSGAVSVGGGSEPRRTRGRRISGLSASSGCREAQASRRR